MMAKKKTVQAPKPPDAAAPSKARLELRIDTEVYEGIRRLADRAQISVNQLMHGLARWASDNGYAGEPERDAEGFLRNKSQPGCVWFGTTGWKLEELDEDEVGLHYEELAEVPEKNRKGKLELFLDFTERRVRREDVE